MSKHILVHGTCVALGTKGVLLLGSSGSGKSDLALRLIHDGATLVADDRVVLSVKGDKLAASAPTTTAPAINRANTQARRSCREGIQRSLKNRPSNLSRNRISVRATKNKTMPAKPCTKPFPASSPKW